VLYFRTSSRDLAPVVDIPHPCMSSAVK
jgi:hypothetical protein